MPIRDVWETVENNGERVVSDWSVSTTMRAKLDQKLDMLSRAEVTASGQVNLPNGLLAGPNIYGQPGIYKLKVNGKLALRPMLCRGPLALDREWTVLARAREQDDDTREQEAAAATAAVRREQVLVGSRARQRLIEGER